MDVNEKIVTSWLQNKSFFTINSIYYGQYHNDIDILAINLKQKVIWDCEIKVRTGSTMISDNNNKQNGFNHFLSTFNDAKRSDKIFEYIDNQYSISKKFITTRSLFGKTEENQNKWFKRFKDNNIDVIYFDEVMKELSNFSIKTKKSTDEIIQVLKLFHIANTNSDTTE